MQGTGQHTFLKKTMTKKESTKGHLHLHQNLLKNVLKVHNVTAMCVENYLSSMSEEELDKWVRTFYTTGFIKK